MKKMYPKRKPMERKHMQGMNCWCRPEEIYTAPNGNSVFVHKGMGEELPPSHIIAQAIADAIADR